MQITINLDEELAAEIVRWKRALDSAVEKMTGMNVYGGLEDKFVVDLAVSNLIREGLDWEKKNYGLIVVDTGEAGAGGDVKEGQKDAAV